MKALTFLMTSSFYPPNHVGGACLQTKYLSEELAKAGHEVHVFYSLDASSAKKKWQAQNEQQGLVHIHTVKTPFNTTAYAAYLLGCSSPITKKFQKLVKEIKPDVVHHHNISLLGFPILKKTGDYLNIYTAHDYWLMCQFTRFHKNVPEYR
jgi:glycosyltransferase involved in cell wall biosynthesis